SSSAILPFIGRTLPQLFAPAALRRPRARLYQAPSLGAFADEVAQLRIDAVAPAAAVEHAVMADARLQMVALLGCGEARQQAMDRRGLADGADVVVLALDGEDRGAGDGAGIDPGATRDEFAACQRLAMEHAIDGLKIEIRRQIHHRRIFVVEFPRRL